MRCASREAGGRSRMKICQIQMWQLRKKHSVLEEEHLKDVMRRGMDGIISV